MDNTCITPRSPVYSGLLEQLRGAIAGGVHGPGEFLGTEVELSRARGISRVSVRRATEQLIREGLIERRAGRGLFVREADRVTQLVHVVVPDLGFEQCAQIARGAKDLAAEQGIKVQVYDANNRLDRDIATLQQLPETEARGALILSWHHPRFSEAMLQLKQASFPFVVVDEHPREVLAPSVTADNHAGGMLVGHALADLGHRRIGFIGNLAADTVQARLDGLRDAVNDRGIAFDRSLVVDLCVQPQEDWAGRINECTRGLASRRDRPTAIFFSDDQVAAEGCCTLRAMGLRIPADISVVGFDDSPLCRWLDPPLASVRQPSVEIGRAAMEMLLSVIGRKEIADSNSPERRTLGVEWVPRASIGTAPVLA
jgi:DNA-binding LacI/PurR family transcriptional regulator